jgi:tetratricopeptide (TPR) repeat protein
VYAAWPADQESKRRDARVELIELLLRIGARAQAEAELIALGENVGDDPTQQERIGNLFLRAKDYEHALAAFRVSLRSDPHDEGNLAGAGTAAFELGQYTVAQHYLAEGAAMNPQNAEIAETVLKMNPFRRQISAKDRSEIVREAFALAGQRIKNCAVPTSAAPGGIAAEKNLSDEWNQMRPKITDQHLRTDPELVDSAMDVVFRIERQTSILCGQPAGDDLALLLIAKSQGS